MVKEFSQFNHCSCEWKQVPGGARCQRSFFLWIPKQTYIIEMLHATFDSSHFLCIQLPISFLCVHLAMMYHHSFTSACVTCLGRQEQQKKKKKNKKGTAVEYFILKKCHLLQQEALSSCPYRWVDFSNLSSPDRNLFLLYMKLCTFLNSQTLHIGPDHSPKQQEEESWWRRSEFLHPARGWEIIYRCVVKEWSAAVLLGVTTRRSLFPLFSTLLRLCPFLKWDFILIVLSC